MSSWNEPAASQLRSWSCSGALAPSQKSLHVRGTQGRLFNDVYDWVFLVIWPQIWQVWFKNSSSDWRGSLHICSFLLLYESFVLLRLFVWDANETIKKMCWFLFIYSSTSLNRFLSRNKYMYLKNSSCSLMLLNAYAEIFFYFLYVKCFKQTKMFSKPKLIKLQCNYIFFYPFQFHALQFLDLIPYVTS